MTKIAKQLLSSPFIRSYAYRELHELMDNVTQKDIDSFVELTVDDAIINGPKMYKVYAIPKRNGGRRIIAHPSRPLKAVQRDLIEILKCQLPIHDAAFAYQQGKSIKGNAEVHRFNKFFLKMDLSNFFNSIDVELFYNHLDLNSININIEDKSTIKNIIFWRPQKNETGGLRLSVGAPSSPLISNFIMYKFDSIISEVCASFKIKYSRYADDLFFSTTVKGVLFKIPDIVEFILKSKYDDVLTINKSKTSFSSKAHNRHITGITITNSNELSLGRNRKRYISSLVHKYRIGLLDNNATESLQGLLAFAKNIEPEFLMRLKNKYSSDVIESIISGRWKNHESEE